MKLHYIGIKDKKLFERFLALSAHNLSAYAFPNIYIWKELYDISWSIIDGNLCVFFRDKTGCFLYLPPLASKISPAAIDQAFKIMDDVNSNSEISRIENAEDKDLPLYKGLGYGYNCKSSDYICSRAQLEELKGDKFKSKRSSCNYFIKHYAGFKYLPFILKYKEECLRLFEAWRSQRAGDFADKLYKGMLEDTARCLKVLFGHYRELGVKGRVALLDKEIKGFTFGFELNRDTFCVLYEITDLSVKGLAQFIFREFCSELNGYRYINIMDDCGLENLKRVKLSYQPVKLIPAYIIKRKK